MAVGRLKLAGLGAAGLLLSLLQLGRGAEWIKPFFYLFAWWSLLACLAGLNGIVSGRSRLLDEPRSYLRMALVSVPWWLLFEALNLRLRNWAYRGVPEPAWLRWPGYALAFATVLPAVLELAELLESIWTSRASCRPRQGLLSPASARTFRTAGALSIALPLAWPGFFFPLIWGALFLLLEPGLARRSPEESWLGRLSKGRPGRLYGLLLSGLACGLLWESLNYRAGAKWVYTVPWPGGPKLFEMPWLGYLGFPPFALECASAWAAFESLWKASTPGRKWAAALGLAAFSLAAFRGIDSRTVLSFARIF